MKTASNPVELIPVLPYDFNMPPRNDRYHVLRGFWDLRLGQRVKFGFEADETMAYGRVVGFPTESSVHVAFEEWC